MEDFKAAYYELLKKNTQLEAQLIHVTKTCEDAKKKIAEYIDELNAQHKNELSGLAEEFERVFLDVKVIIPSHVKNQIAQSIFADIDALRADFLQVSHKNRTPVEDLMAKNPLRISE